MVMLKQDQKLKSENNVEYIVNEKIGEGGQGEVYEVGHGDNSYALKWYFGSSATEGQKKTIINLIRKGEPNSFFLWPKDIIHSEDSFGYVMPLRPKHYKSIVDLMKRRAEPTFYNLCIVGINLSESFQKVHSLGYSYRDISFGNLFFDPNNGDVLICDNDNVSVNGLNNSGVLGTPRFMAPEIVLGEAHPSTDTDLFSMAIMLFYIFMIHHPLEGENETKIKCLDEPAMKKLYGKDPVFIWDPNNTSNRPLKGYHDNAIIYWDLYPEFIKELFVNAFTFGLRDPKKRIVEKVWQNTFVRLLNSIVICPHCKSENFYDENKNDISCWGCEKKLVLPMTIKIGKNLIFLNKTTVILQHHIKGDFDLKTVMGELVQNPKDPKKWGIRNKSDSIWTYIKKDGKQILIDKGKTAGLATGAKIDFGGIIGEYK